MLGSLLGVGALKESHKQVASESDKDDNTKNQTCHCIFGTI